ncbi:hypothetical protein ACHAXR_009314 [Thalassiosira sp. AJA248-18]
MQNVQPKVQSSSWLAKELLKRTDLSSGDICMFHYPMDFFPNLDVNDMGMAFEMITEGQLNRISGEDGARNDIEAGEMQQDEALHQNNADIAPPAQGAPAYMSNASLEARNQINRLQFSWYQFTEFPREVLGMAYSNLQHLDMRQNASLTCIDSLISQLPNLISLNLTDCPNIRTLTPLATTLAMPTVQQANDFSLGAPAEENLNNPPIQRTLSLRHLWVRGCNLSFMSREDWANVFDALAESSGPLERLTLSRNNMSYLHGNIGKLSLHYLFVEDNDGGDTMKCNAPGKGFEIPDELGNLTSLRFVSFCGNGVTSLPRTMGRLNDNCDVYLHRNPKLMYPPPAYQRSIKTMRLFFHKERMALLRGAVLFMPHCKRARLRANERLYRPGGWGYEVCKERFEESARRTSITLMSD